MSYKQRFAICNPRLTNPMQLPVVYIFMFEAGVNCRFGVSVVKRGAVWTATLRVFPNAPMQTDFRRSVDLFALRLPIWELGWLGSSDVEFLSSDLLSNEVFVSGVLCLKLTRLAVRRRAVPPKVSTLLLLSQGQFPGMSTS